MKKSLKKPSAVFVLFFVVLAGLIWIFLQAPVEVSAMDPIRLTPTPSYLEDDYNWENELPDPALFGALVVLFLLLLFVVLILVAGLFFGLVFLGFGIVMGFSAVIGLVRKNWQDGARAFFSQMLLIIFTLSGLTVGWFMKLVGLLEMKLWIISLAGGLLGFFVGLVMVLLLFVLLKTFQDR